jgi:hypothetical protein
VPRRRRRRERRTCHIIIILVPLDGEGRTWAGLWSERWGWGEGVAPAVATTAPDHPYTFETLQHQD